MSLHVVPDEKPSVLPLILSLVRLVAVATCLVGFVWATLANDINAQVFFGVLLICDSVDYGSRRSDR